MQVDRLGYRSWVGNRVSRLLRPLVIAQAGIALVWRRKWLRMMLIFSWLPIIAFAVAIFAFELSSTNAGARNAIGQVLSFQFQRPDLALQMATDHEGMRHEVWSMMILTFFRAPQLFSMVLLVGLIAPMLISYDLRSKAYLMYFSRPLTPGEYIVGKSAVLWFFLCMITALPALALYALAIFVSPDLSVIGQTWDIPLRILAATVALIVPITAMALCYSSFTSESRYATFSWFATWAMGFVAYNVLTGAQRVGQGGDGRWRQRRRFRSEARERFEENAGDFDPNQFDGFQPGGRGRGRPGVDFEELVAEQQQILANVDFEKWRLLSPYHTLGKVEAWLFGLDTSDTSIWPSIILLLLITVLGSLIIRHRIRSKLKV